MAVYNAANPTNIPKTHPTRLASRILDAAMDPQSTWFLRSHVLDESSQSGAGFQHLWLCHFLEWRKGANKDMLHPLPWNPETDCPKVVRRLSFTR